MTPPGTPMTRTKTATSRSCRRRRPRTRPTVPQPVFFSFCQLRLPKARAAACGPIEATPASGEPQGCEGRNKGDRGTGHASESRCGKSRSRCLKFRTFFQVVADAGSICRASQLLAGRLLGRSVLQAAAHAAVGYSQGCTDLNLVFQPVARACRGGLLQHTSNHSVRSCPVKWRKVITSFVSSVYATQSRPRSLSCARQDRRSRLLPASSTPY